MTIPPDTVLVIASSGVPLYSCRNATQSFGYIDALAKPRRDGDGVLRDVSYEQFRKYQSKITCTDFHEPATYGIWVGSILVVDCIFELNYPVGGSPDRTVVTGSDYTESGDTVTHYRPQLTFMVMNLTASLEEYSRRYTWELDLEEV